MSLARCFVALLGVVIVTTALASPGVGKGPRARARPAEAQLRGGMPILAAETARACLAEHPDELPCRDVLGRALAFVGQCREGLEVLADVRRSGTWTARAALAEGICRVRVEDFEGAVAAFDEAAVLDPEDVVPWLQRGLVHARLGRVDALERDRAEVLARVPHGWQIDLLDLWHAYATEAGDVDWRLWWFWRHEARGADITWTTQVGLVDCYHWLDLGDPGAADRAARRAAGAPRGHARLLACRAEALRRLGDPLAAAWMTDRPWEAEQDAPALDVVLARALVDQGRLDEASDVLAALVRPDEPAVTATAWYVARARGHEDEAVRLARRHADLAAPGDRRLALLLPLVETP